MSQQLRVAPKEERLFSLVLALVASPQGVTKTALLSSVHGYAERSRQGVTSAALDRQFERDKEELRALGIRIETIDSPLESGNNQLTRYRISKEQLELPADLKFTRDELMLLRLAAISWRETSIGTESRRAAMKLEALGAGLDVRQLGVAPTFGTQAPAAAPLKQAIERGVVVVFDYLVPRYGQPVARRVAPLRLHRAEGRWHLIAWDLDRDAGRTFLLSRISGEVSVGRRRFDEHLLGHVEGLIADLEHLREEQRSIVEVVSGSVAEARLVTRARRPRREQPGRAARSATLDIGTLDYHELAEELVDFGADVRVIEPEQLRELVTQALERIADEHD